MSDPKPPLQLELIWEHDLVLSGTARDITLTLDSDGSAGPSPMQALAFALTGCMAMDVVHVIRKGRHDLKGLRVDFSGTRADQDPRRFTAISLHFTVTGSVPDDVVQRAIDLSRDKYCSVWHSMRQDIELSATFRITDLA